MRWSWPAELGDEAGAALAGYTPDRLYRSLVYGTPEPPASVRALALPRHRLGVPLRAGDAIVRVALGEPGLGHVAVLVDGRLMARDELAARRVTAEDRAPGYYAIVVEDGATSHRANDDFARLVTDAQGVVPRGQAVIRLEPSRGPMESEDLGAWDEAIDVPELVQEALPGDVAAWEPGEDDAEGVADLAKLEHIHTPKTVVSGSLTAAARTTLRTADMNPGFIDAGDALVVDTSATGLQTCLHALMRRSFGALLATPTATTPSARDHAHVAVVDLTGARLAQPDFAGWGSTVAMNGASVPKILALYGAHQLRADVQHLADSRKPATGHDLERLAAAEWARRALKRQLPDLAWLFDIRSWKPGDAVQFTSAARDTFTHIMDNCPAGQLIARVGFPYIGSLTWQSGIHHPGRGGLWLNAAYCSKGAWAQPPIRPPHGHNATALSAATFFTLLAQGRLVDDAASAEIRTSLANGCVTSLFPALPVVASKCGLWNGYVHDTVLVQDAEVRYVMVVLSRLTIGGQTAAYTRLCTELDALIRRNNAHPKTACP